MNIKIMVTSIGATGALNILRSYRRMEGKNIKLIGADFNENVAGKYFVDKFYKIPHGNDEKYLEAILDICQKEKVDILIPIFGNELLKISKNIEKFKKRGILVPISNSDVLETCFDKEKTYEFFNKISIEYPKIYKNLDEIRETDLPLFVKPKISLFGGSRGAYKIEKLDELKNMDFEKYIVQEYIKGKEFSVDTFSDLNGKVIGIVPRERLEVRNGIAIKTITRKDNKIIEETKKLLGKLKIKGPANIQCFKIKNRVIFFEINPRFGGSYIASIEAGLNAPKYLLDIYRGNEIKTSVGDFKETLLTIRYLSEVFFEEK